MDAGFNAVSQKVHRGLAPFLLTEGVTVEAPVGIPAPHFSLEKDAVGRGISDVFQATRD
jgi:hypothetical protein